MTRSTKTAPQERVPSDKPVRCNIFGEERYPSLTVMERESGWYSLPKSLVRRLYQAEKALEDAENAILDYLKQTKQPEPY